MNKITLLNDLYLEQGKIVSHSECGSFNCFVIYPLKQKKNRTQKEEKV